MIDLEQPNQLTKYKSTLKDTSKEQNEVVYMTESLYNVVNFDSVKKKSCNRKFCGLRSNDALLIPSPNSNEKFAFIEFKNGCIEDKGAITQITEKIYESLLIFNEIVQENLSFDKENIVYILVYNENDNGKFSTDAHSAQLANEKYIIPDLERYQKLFFDFQTLNKIEFQKITDELDKGNYPFHAN